ncbi:YebC/PmpR family DNA-binding transcriptional regulator [Candidatus Uhrbacteria bacterium CG10_big_fil_rev_8_21_14_0_10_50_16]|uniref:Probable transcriptional regulatory protein COV06_02020 n=1 Tax=Candidatus Uhrbacteria bacterium CG10_big_fil_rev_8_21_14_0_10_50_16 TaxID=1975039 RepID=A0A2H0RML9_9BACT|nr:MAG: YebC/PmpR family DNA-binding transcriptional regulator [Candidatus Uhrbacteria bacterium CG10_big_fil_rev_8_21_14_0_10_50_16]
MSGHNKWSKIKNKKGAADAKRAGAFTKIAKAIAVAAREGGGDMSMNFKLRIAVDSAKAANMPNDNIDRAIKRGTGEGEGNVMVEGLYEAYGPKGVAFVISTLSDNKNRTVAEVQTALKKSGATPAEQGSVLFNFDRKVVVVVARNAEVVSPEDMEIALIEAGAEDIEESDEGWIVTGAIDTFKALIDALEAMNIKPEEASLQYVSKMPMEVDEEAHEKVEKITDALEDLDDVQEVFTNIK